MTKPTDMTAAGKATGFIVAAVLARYHQDGTLPAPEELESFLKLFVKQGTTFDAETLRFVQGVLKGIAFAVRSDGNGPL